MNTALRIAVVFLSLGLAACGDADRPAEVTAHDDADDHSATSGSVRLTAEQIAAAGIGILQAAPRPIRDALPLYGVVALNAERVREVTARYPGLISTVTRKVGDTVRLGEGLATIESNESLRTYEVVAPLSGVVTTRNANAGEQTADRTLFTVADLSSVWVELSLFPRDTPKVRIGQQVRISSNGVAAEGKVVYVAPFGTSSSQTLVARVLLDNTERRWAPGLYVTAEVILAEQSAAVTVRNDALQAIAGESVVFVRTGEGFEVRPVRIGRSDGEYSEVLGGLRVGEPYAAHNSFILKAELGKGEAAHED